MRIIYRLVAFLALGLLEGRWALISRALGLPSPSKNSLPKTANVLSEYLDAFRWFLQALASKAATASIRFINSAATLVSLAFVFSTAFGFSDTTVVDVRIVSLDHEQSKVTVSYGGNSRELKLAQDVTIEIDGREPLLVIKEGGDWHDWPGNVWEYFVVEWDKNGH